MARFVLLFLAACQNVLAAKNPACSNFIYSKFAAYSTIKPVSSFCLSKFPPQTQTSVVSTATTTTTTSTLTITATTDSTSTVTKYETIYVQTTVPAPVGPAKRAAATTLAKVVKASPSPACPELDALKILAANIVATACSCIISTPTVTSTKTATLTSTATATTATIVANIITTTTTSTTTVLTVVTAAPVPIDIAPTCTTPSTCSTISRCGGGNVAACICERTVEGNNVCINETGLGCGTPCSSSAACGVGFRCVTTTCCSGGGPGTCLRTSAALGNTCTNVAARVIQTLQGVEKDVIGAPLHKPL
ncbi:hypothetical protein CC86DRAFT_451328 [Ophiobolus disseminans]|uniref:Extracellular membrane protein CFEM domain-containing protein n=1 Tax=Ophiobolus disseminans TaxID=1469910 RepID=A0A6A7AM35_9PLEO|nr:hypothetical protein CC86DRAFT_451328 [Ophiobolus disseminans]